MFAAVASRLRALSPLAKLAVWAGSIVVLVAIAELLEFATGLPVSLLTKSAGGVVLLVVALVTLLAVLASEARPAAEYGLVIPANWRRQAFGGMAVGAMFYAAYLVACQSAGVIEWKADAITPSRCAKAALAAVSSIPVSAVQQIIFAGLLLGMLRRATSAIVAVLVPAMVFGLFAAASRQDATAPQLFVGLTLLAVLLGVVRLRTGTIVMSTGLLAGAIAVRRIVSKLRLADLDPTNPWTPWLAPLGDPRLGPVFWTLLTIATAIVTVIVIRHGEREVHEDPAAAASFKRVMPLSNLMAFAPIDRWMVELARARFAVGLMYLPRLVFTLVASGLTTLVTLPERVLAPRLLKHDVPPPVFIVGMHRSGTTHLHNLMALDPQFRSPRNFEVLNPHGFLTGWLTTAAMAPLLMWRRPMDSVQMTVLSTQEEEFALAAMGGESPYWMFCFPRRTGELERYWWTDRFESRELARWQQHYVRFLRKLTWRSLRRPLLKNPVNTCRVAMLHEMFPTAQFVYIVRHPHAVYRSNMHFAEHGFAVFQLQDTPPVDSYAQRFLDQYRHATDACEHDLHSLPFGTTARVRFEDLERNPLHCIQQIYDRLGLELSGEYRAALDDYLDRTANYHKNRFGELPPLEAAKVDAIMGPYLIEWGYAPSEIRKAA
ncbi:sulfotransferase [Aeoliella sp.]|uniref:sulfotransferase n=1 Tax=Aeoliella sp. TaxID=2795800 RepID=UPI003CCB9953